jgi:hypothetical protein
LFNKKQKRQAKTPAFFELGHHYLLLLQLSPTAFTEVASRVLEAVAVAVAPVDAPPAPLALGFPPWFGCPEAELLFGALVSALLLAEAEALDPTVPITSTCLFTFELSCDSSPCTLYEIPVASVSI